MPLPEARRTIAQQSALLREAQHAASHAYAPYSAFRVGAALLLADGNIVSGANVENASYGLTMCAERSAVVRAVAEHGPTMRIAAVAVANLNGASSSPCGACRQVLAEFMLPGGLVLFPADGVTQCSTLTALLPYSFGLPHGE